MKIILTGTKGRSTITNTIDVKGLREENDLKEVVLVFFDFLIAMGATLPDELFDIIDEHRDVSDD